MKALIEIGTFLGYAGDELKQFLNEERMRMDREKEEKEMVSCIATTSGQMQRFNISR